MTEETLLKKLKIYKGIGAVLLSVLFAAIGYIYTLRLDMNYLEIKQQFLLGKVELLEGTLIKNINEWIWAQSK